MFKVYCLIGIALFLIGCAAGFNPSLGIPDIDNNVAGFWMGLWHGIIIPITWIVSLFTDNVSIYEAHNSGGWYDLGFILGLGTSVRSGSKAM